MKGGVALDQLHAWAFPFYVFAAVVPLPGDAGGAPGATEALVSL